MDGRLAQLVRAPALHAGCRRFESVTAYHHRSAAVDRPGTSEAVSRNTLITTFTLDTNCLIDVEENRPWRDSVLRLIAAADKGTADVAMVASSASERQPGGEYLKTFTSFRERMQELGFGSLKMLKTIARFDLSFWDHAITPSESQIER